MLRTILRGLAIAVLALAILTARVVGSSYGELERAHAADGDDRIAHLGLAARLYAPLNPFSLRAFNELAEIGRASASDADTRLRAWREVRSSILATRSFYTPHRAMLDEANAHIADLMAAIDHTEPAAQSRAWHAARLAIDDAPSVGWTVVALVGLFSWLGAAIAFCLRGLDEQDRLRRRPALLSGIVLGVGLLLFFVGLARA